MREKKYWQGQYKVKNPEKYRGDPTQVFFRSRPELVYMMSLDTDPAVLGWSSESVIVPYVDPNDKRVHRYFVDFFVERMEDDGSISKKLVEYKPQSQVERPSRPKEGVTRRFLTEVSTWVKNQAKWDAARDYCKKRGWEFEVLSEADLGIQQKRAWKPLKKFSAGGKSRGRSGPGRRRGRCSDSRTKS